MRILFLIFSLFLVLSCITPTSPAMVTSKNHPLSKVKVKGQHLRNKKKELAHLKEGGRPRKMLSLDEAILLAVRTNPNVQSTRLDFIRQKFDLWVEEWQFLPHYSFQAETRFNCTGSPGENITGSHRYNATPGITVNTPIGTTIGLTSTNLKTGHYNPGLSVEFTQPLLRGFGTAIVETAYHNAQDSLEIQKLTIEGTLRTTVTSVINAFLDVISAQKRIHISEDAVKRAEKSVTDTKLFIKAGRKAGNDLVTVQANVASAKATLENDRNQLLQARYALLTAIGIDPNNPVELRVVDLTRVIAKYHLPPLEVTKQQTLENDIAYQTEEIMLHGQKFRSLLVAEDNTRWKLTLSGNASTGSGTGGGQSAGLNSVFNGANQNQSIELKLEVPIDDQTSKQQLLNAKIALKQAKLAQLQKKWSTETSAINGWNSVISAARSLHFAEDAERLQEKTYYLSYQKYLHGLIDSLELQQAQVRLIEEQQTLLRNRIEYLKSLVNLDQTIGNTLKTWGIQVRL